MLAKELRDLTVDELAVKERELKESLFLLKLRQRTNQLESPAKLAHTRRDIARIHTIRSEREIGAKK